MSKISEVLTQFDTDKAREHHYGAVYDEVFAKFGEEINILEIGVQKGGSLLAWKQFRPKANVVGMDIVDTRKYKSDDVAFILGDFRETFMQVKDMQFDIIIDDGSHFLRDVIFTVNNYIHLLKPEGILVIEDIQEPVGYTMRVLDILPPGYKMDTRDMTSSGRYDDFIILINKE